MDRPVERRTLRHEHALSATERRSLRLLVDARRRQLLVAGRGGARLDSSRRGYGPRIALSDVTVPLRPDAISRAVRVPHAA